MNLQVAGYKINTTETPAFLHTNKVKKIIKEELRKQSALPSQ